MNTPDTLKIQRALISVSDKRGIVEFARKINQLGVEIFSTGGTKAKLAEAGVPVKSVSELTKFPEILNGRVKTLHPAVHGGLLADLGKDEHIKQLKEHELASIDMLVVNLYPFEQALKRNAGHDELIENIDIGGPTMLRSAAKNYKWTLPIVDPDDYEMIYTVMEGGCRTVPEETRKELAGKVFAHTAYYDSLIADYFRDSTSREMPEKTTIPLRVFQMLRYGENPHQNAALYGNYGRIFKQLHGKELSYNNIIDIDGASRVILDFDKPTVALVKHTNPCGVGVADNLQDAYKKAFATDTVSPYGGIFVMNRPCNLEMAETVHDIFAEVLIAPSFTDNALELLTKKKNRRLIVADFVKLRKSLKTEVRSVAGGFLMQNSDTKVVPRQDMKVVTKRQPTEEEWDALEFGWKIVKHVKSNAIVYTGPDRTLAIGAGQMSRVDSSRIAVEKSKLMGLDLAGSAMASDAFFPFADGVVEAVKAGATCVIQPGGSIRDEEVIKAADENNVAMVFTGQRHFRH